MIDRPRHGTGALRLMVFSALALMPFAAAAQSASADDDAAAAGVVAAQVRNQGLACDDPVSAARDPESDDDAVWTLTCKNASYRVRLVPDMAAEIEKIQ